jgi:hypothetical protein
MVAAQKFNEINNIRSPQSTEVSAAVLLGDF